LDSHADITTLSADQLHDELEKVEVILGKILGIKPTWFRYMLNAIPINSGN
jgi:peptidoglycan/xylan/chitin deacetylase (PgdA/CDA1 family)